LVAVVDATVATVIVASASSALARLAMAARRARVAQRHMACGTPAAAGQNAWEGSARASRAAVTVKTITRASCHRHLAARRYGSGL
jgi:hypothetical protein